MTADDNKRLIQRYYEEVHNQHNLGLVDELFAPDFVCHPNLDLNAYKQVIQMSQAAFPDVQVTIEAQIAEGDMVATRWKAEGTHLGVFAGIPPTGRRIRVTAMQFNRFREGKIVEHWEQFDMLNVLRQLGVISP